MARALSRYEARNVVFVASSINLIGHLLRSKREDTLSPQSLKLNLVPRTQTLGLFGPPKKRVIFGTFNKRQICIFCVFDPNFLSNKLLMIYSCVLFILFTIACISTLF